MERIVLGYDGSPAAVSALSWTAARAARGVAKVDVVLVVSPLMRDRAPGLERLSDAETFLLDRLPGLEVELHRLEGSVTESISQAATDADLVVIGINSGHPIRAAAAGWTPLRLSTRSTTPVYMIPAGWVQGDDPVTVGVADDGTSDAALECRSRRGHRDLDRTSPRPLLADADPHFRRRSGVDNGRGCCHRRPSADSRQRRSASAEGMPRPAGRGAPDPRQPISCAPAIRLPVVTSRHRHASQGRAGGESAGLGRPGHPLARGLSDLRRTASVGEERNSRADRDVADRIRSRRVTGHGGFRCSSWKIAACVRRSSPSLLSSDET